MERTPYVPPPLVDYHVPSHGRRRTIEPRLRRLSALLAALSAACAGYPWWEGFDAPVVDFGCGLAVVATVGFVLRAWGRPFAPFLTAWAAGVAVFALWAMIYLSDHFHGQPPPSNLYLIFCWSASCAMAVVGLWFDTRRPAPP